MKPINIPSWIIITLCIGLSLAGSFKMYQIIHNYEVAAWHQAARPSATKTVAMVKSAFDVQFSVLEQFSLFATFQDKTNPAQLATQLNAYVTTLLSNQASLTEVSVAYFENKNSRLGHVWSFGTASAYKTDSQSRNALLKLLNKSKLHPKKLNFLAAETDAQNQSYILAGIAYPTQDGFDFFISRIDLSLIKVGVIDFEPPVALAIHLTLTSRDNPVVDWHIGKANLPTDFVITHEQDDLLWQFNVAVLPSFERGANHKLSVKALAIGFFIALCMGLMLGLLAWHRRYINSAHNVASSALKNAEIELSQLKKTMKSTARFSILKDITPALTAEISPIISQSITTTTSLEEAALNIKDKVAQGKLTKSSISKFIDNTIHLSTLSANNILKAGEFAYNLNQVSTDLKRDKPREIYLEMHIQEIISLIKPTYKNKKLNFIATIPQDLTLTSLPGSLTQVITLGLTNSIIHGFKGKTEGTIMIEAFKGQSNQDITIRIEDNGNGIESSLVDAINAGEEHPDLHGIGLILIKEVTQNQLSCQFKLESRIRKYTRLTFNFTPKTKAAAQPSKVQNTEKDAAKGVEKEAEKSVEKDTDKGAEKKAEKSAEKNAEKSESVTETPAAPPAEKAE